MNLLVSAEPHAAGALVGAYLGSSELGEFIGIFLLHVYWLLFHFFWYPPSRKGPDPFLPCVAA